MTLIQEWYSCDMEIERKFLVKEIPNLEGIKSIPYERYFVKIDPESQERIQKKGDSYEYEIKRVVPGVGNVSQHLKEKRTINKEEFDNLKEGKENEGIIREGFNISSNPDVSIKIYHGRFEGLVRAEVEFENSEEAEKYIPESWMGEEITNYPLGMDSRLLHLSREEFNSLLKRHS